MIVLCRHAITSYNAESRFLSRTNVSLSNEGRTQARRLRSELSSFDVARVFSSPALRCQETAELALPNHDIAIVQELREVDFGMWEGLTEAEVEEKWPGELDSRRLAPASFRPPRGENFDDVARRLADFADFLLRTQVHSAVISHRGTLGTLERLLLRLDVADSSVAPLEPAEFHVIDRERLIMSAPSLARPSASSKTSLQ